MSLLKRVTEEEIGPNASTDLAVWLFFQIAAGHIALPILTATLLFAKTVRKIPALIVLCVTWIVSGVCSTILFYVGEHKGPEPGRGLCIAQAALLEAVPPMTCTALVVLAYHVLRTYDDPDMGVQLHPRTRKEIIGLVSLCSLPFVMFGLFVAIGVNIALQHPDKVNRAQRYFYCSLDWPALSDAVSVIATLLCLVALGIEIYVVAATTKWWRLLRRGGHLTGEGLTFTIRVVFFTCFLFASTLINLVSIWAPIGALPDLLAASVGMALFLIFVSQPEILRAWAFWRRRTSGGDEHGLPHDSLTLHHHRFDAGEGGLPSLSSTYTLDAGHSNPMLPPRDRYDSKQSTSTVQIIKRPEEAFTKIPERTQRQKKRDTISTWGF
ncbi:uncharacterized protein PHACADRAFT_262243 [Phanerochaete carnosa HHB-10118-sp]|uniref:Uncharacterized protein n=1 Tax=Phanerochaete carnosa (strain HHB-10118-sp) TaxID=650164 RepID=K5VKF4_PHACS|nr:uncharacterized protein PHACADRAFT_262243 [Phanerochaete carnosa HHB-10118-sp]EKM51858.1 hypothetical protein PHACADRAFT_262243 [Phanerochaete carnosa HHB-10118-sp]